MTKGSSGSGKGRVGVSWGLRWSLGLGGLCAASLAGACLYFLLAYVPGQRAASIKGWQQELVLRADLHKMTLDHWVAVGLADADILAVYPTPRALVPDGEGTLTASRAADAAAHLREVAERFARMRGYHRFVLLDANLHIVVGVGAAPQLERPDLQAAAEVLAQGKTMVDFHRYTDGRVAVVFLARVGADTASRTGGGVVLLEADPNKWLYPYLAMRPMAALSAETVLVRREGDDIVYLSPLRHHPAPPLTFRRPANVTGFAALAAVEGREGFGEYVDYRNEPVFAAVVRLDRAPWGLVVKVDQRDALATYRREIRRTGAAAVAAFVGFWALAFLVVLGWRRRAEQRLASQHELLRESQKALVEAQRVARVGSWEWDAVRDKITGSEEFYRLFDVAPEDIARFPQFAERLHPDDRARVEQDVAEALHLERPYDTDYRVKLRDGGWRDINARGKVFLDDGGKPLQMIGTCLDITERKQAEKQIARLNSELEAKVVERTSELKDEMELVQKIVSASPVGIFACRADGPCVLANPAIARISGAPVEKMLQLNFHELPAWKQNGLHDKAQAALATGMDQHADIHLTTSFGRDAWLNYTFTTFERGGMPHFLMLIEEITARKHAEAALQVSEELSRTTLYSIGDGVIATDAAGLVARMNPVAELLTGWSEAEASGKPLAHVFQIINEETRAGVENPVEHPLREGKAVGLANHTLLIARDGTERPVADSGAPIRNEKGEVTGVVLVFRDRTDERAAQRALHEHAVRLQESNKELEAFSYSVSHDLRAPLRAIDGFTRILTGDYAPQLDTEGQRVCSVIHENTRKMSQLIDDLLAFSRLGRAEMSLSRTDMETMANSVFHELTTPESRARIDFQVGVLPPAVADPTLMRQVWMNLLANAIKFSSKRERAIIRVSAQQSQGENVYVVQDHGAGFEMQYAGKLFGVFQRLHTSREFEGTGVGLALVQRVIRRHGGRVWAEGEPDKGATFYFALQQRGA
jgi:PAS domain S-box-containing protein